MITDKQVDALREAINDYTGCIIDPNDLLDIAQAYEKAAWRPISEWGGQRGFAIVADCFGSQPAEFDPDPTLEDFLSICDEGEGPEDFPAYLAEYPGEGWRTTTADEVEYLDPTHFRPLPKGPSDE